MTDESSIIARLCGIIPNCAGSAPAREVFLGIGDDAALIRSRAGHNWVVSTDAFIEGRHFLARLHPPYQAGFKALARATSDLAAMGATPRYFLLTLALPARKADSWLGWFARGMAHGARMFCMKLIGGDVCRHDHVVAALTVMGEAPRRGVLTRSGARPSDALFVTGRLGAAQAGLEVFSREGRRAFVTRAGSYWIDRHLLPYPRIAIGQMLASRRIASAAMDISDGLSIDLPRLCAASGVGALVHAGSLPLSGREHFWRRDADSARERASELHRALHGGEDYELLFTVPRRLISRVPSTFRGVPITRIGEICKERKVMLEKDGRTRMLRPLGWDHFGRK